MVCRWLWRCAVDVFPGEAAVAGVPKVARSLVEHVTCSFSEVFFAA